MTIKLPSFPIERRLKLVAMQSDCVLDSIVSASESSYRVRDAEAVRMACRRLLELAQEKHAHLAVVPELTIPECVLTELVERVRSFPVPIVFIGGLEGLNPQRYRSLVEEYGGNPDLAQDVTGSYVNPLVVLVQDGNSFAAYFRCKRYGSGPENQGGPELVLSCGPYLSLQLGPTPFNLVPLICSDLLDPELGGRLQQEIEGEVDIVLVIQRNNDPQERWAQVINQRFQNGTSERFVLVNHSLTEEYDGRSYVIAPPSCPSAPEFSHLRHELWITGTSYKGFRVPDRMPCIWFAEIDHRTAPMNATRPMVCRGFALEALDSARPGLVGLAAGLLRGAAKNHLIGLGAAQSEPETKAAYRGTVCEQSSGYLLQNASKTTADAVLFELTSTCSAAWATVEPIITDYVEAAALLSSGGDSVRAADGPGWNCTVGSRPMAILHAPSVDRALVERFETGRAIADGMLPVGVVLVQVQEGPTVPRAKTVGDVIRADTVSSTSEALVDSPPRSTESSVSLRIADVHFCQLSDLRPNLSLATRAEVRNRNQQLFPALEL